VKFKASTETVTRLNTDDEETVFRPFKVKKSSTKEESLKSPREVPLCGPRTFLQM
jgi:hypothetical protein